MPPSSSDRLWAGDDPPLENLMRELGGSVTSLQGAEDDPRSGLLGYGAADSALAGLSEAQSKDGGWIQLRFERLS